MDSFEYWVLCEYHCKTPQPQDRENLFVVSSDAKVMSQLGWVLAAYHTQVRISQESRDTEPYAVQTDLIQAYDEVEAFTSTLCAGCLKTVSPGEGSLARCSLCLTARFCGRECQRKDWKAHKISCPHLAYGRLIRTLTRLFGEGVDVDEAVESRVTPHINQHQALPAWLTEKQLSEVLLLYKCAEEELNGDERLDRISLLNVLLLLNYYTPRDDKTVESLLSECHARLGELPDVEEEVGCEAWASRMVIEMCHRLPQLYCGLKRPLEAVQFAKTVKPNLDVACLALNPRAKGGTVVLLLGFYQMYGEWCKCAQSAIKYNTHKEMTSCVLYQTRLGLYKQAVPLAKSVGETEEACSCLVKQGELCMEGGQYVEAFEAWRQGLEFPWSDVSPTAAHSAVECLVTTRDDALAGSWIDRLLEMDDSCPGRLPVLVRVRLLLYRGVLLSRRRRHEEALRVTVQADEVMRQSRKARGEEEKKAADIMAREILLDRVDYLEALGRLVEARKVERKLGLEASRRPAAVVAKAEVRLGQGRLDAAEGLLGVLINEMTTGEYLGWRWRVKGELVWAESLLPRIVALVRGIMAKGEGRTKALAMLQERGEEEEGRRAKAKEDMRVLAMEEVREEVTGKAQGKKEEGAGQPASSGEGEPSSKAARKKRKKRQKKAAQAQDDSSSQQEAEAGLEEGMAGLDVTQEDEASEGEGLAGGGGKQAGVAEKEECAICLTELEGEGGEDEEGLVCGHVMHAACLRCWSSKCTSLGIDTTCPVCRGPVEPLSN